MEQAREVCSGLKRSGHMIPKDPMMLLSYVNTQLRDFYPDLQSFCEDKNVEVREITDKLSSIDYEYDRELNRFV